jgi:hypothetical protein
MFNILIITIIHLTLFGQSSYIVREYPKLVVVIFGFAFSQLACKMQQCTITHSNVFNQYTKSNLISFFFINLALIVVVHLKIATDPILLDVSITLALILNSVSWFSYGYKLANEIAEIMNINILSVGPRVKKND